MQPIYDVRITAEASGDLLDIYNYIRSDSEQNASQMLERLLHAIDALEHLPYRYKRHRRGGRGRDEVRSMPVPPYVVYYRVVEADRVVRVLTVRHGARRKPRQFGR